MVYPTQLQSRIARLVLALSLPIALSSGPLAGEVEAAIVHAEAWLLGVQNPNGSFGSLADLAPRDTAAAVLALRGAGADQPLALGAIYLEAVPEANTQFRSQRALALEATGRDYLPLLDSLSDFRNGDGMGAFGEHQSTLLDTGLAVEALALEEDSRLRDIASLLDFLELHQSSDGGWGFVPDAPAEVYYTAEVLRSLVVLSELAVGDGVRAGAASFLAARQQADGGFGSVLETALAYRTLLLDGVTPADLPFGSPVPNLLGAQRADGSWEDDAFTTAEVLLALRLERPNLVIAAIDAPAATAPGPPIAVTVTVRNAGPEEAPASRLEIRYGTAGGTLAAEAPVPSLAPGAEIDVALEIETAPFDGTLTLFALADAGGEVTEIDEDDNVRSVEVTLRSGPDLALFPEDLALSPSSPEPDRSFDLLVAARNLGETEVASFGYRVTRLVAGVPAEVLAEGDDGPIAAGGGRLIAVPLALAEGEHTVEVTLDPGRLLEEENEADNRTTSTFFVVDRDRSDLAIPEASFVLAPPEPLAGERVDLSITVENLGARDATADLALFENDPSDGGPELRRFALAVPAGGSETVADTVPLSLGAYALTAVVDPDRVVLETDETNNRAVRVFRDLPDLAIGFDNFEILTPAPLAGDPVEILLTVRNAGTAPATGVEVELTAGGTPVFTGVIDEIPAAGNRGLALTWTAAAGRNVLVARADSGGAILELSETNNQAERELAVPRASGPDLEIAAVDRSGLAESAAALTVAGTVSVTLANHGNEDVTAPFLVRLFEDRDGDERFDGGEPVLGTAIVDDPLAVGASLAVTVALDAAVAFHHPLAWVEADAGDVIAETREDNNKATLFGDCVVAPPAPEGVAEPIEEWFLPGIEVESAPIVVELSDDNGDGRVDSRDVPDVVFHTSDAQGSAILAVSGLDGTELWTFRSTPSNPVLNHLGQLAAADIDGDGVAEVIGHELDGRLIALEHTGEVKWVSDPVEGVGHRGLGGIAIGDLDGDGVPEIVHGRAVVSAAGKLIALGTANRGQNRNFYGPFGVVLPPGVASYPQSLVADLDLDGTNELVAGDAVYRLHGSTLEVAWDQAVPDRLMDDGFSAVGNLDSDPEAEIVYVSSGQIIAYNHDGSVFADRREMVGFLPFQMPTFWGGPPTLADLDGDGAPEILVGTATHLIAYRSNLSKLWQRPIAEDFGGVHGVTAFDLDGDGTREVFFLAGTIGNDAQTLYLLDGATGATLHTLPMISKTGMEYTVVADVDGDGRAELVVPSNVGSNGDASTQGLHVLGHPSWRGTRPIWNQYGYHVTNVLLDGTVPSPQVAPWRADNLFRGNRELPAPPRRLANLTASFPRVGAAGPEGVPVTLRIGNGGREAVGAGVAVELYGGEPSTSPVAARAATTRALLPGRWEDVVVTWTMPGAAGATVFAAVDPDDRVAECAEDDNQTAFEMTETVLPDLEIAAGGVVAPSPSAAGQVLPIAVTVANVGTAAAGFAVRIFDGEPAQGNALGEVAGDVLPPGGRQTVVLPWDTLGSAGVHLIHALVDPDGAVPELAEDNNHGLAQVELTPPSLPDLEIASLAVDPSTTAAGEPVTLTAEVLNRGAALGGFQIAYRVNGAGQARLDSPGVLSTGERRVETFVLDTSALAGKLPVEAIADPLGSIAEENETNNVGRAELAVAGAALRLSVASDKLTYDPGETVALSVLAENLSAAPRDLELRARIVDALGAELADLGSASLSLAPGGSHLSPFAWPVGASLPATYASVAELAAGGAVVARATALFNVARDLSASARLFADRDLYKPRQAVILTGSVSNDSVNTPLGGLDATITVEGSGGTVFASPLAIPLLVQGAAVRVGAVWEIAGAAPGVYTAALRLRDGAGALLAYASTQLAVEDSAETGAGLAGDLEVSPGVVGAGAPLSAAFTIANEGNADVPDLFLRLELLRLADGVVAGSLSLPEPLARGTAATGSVALETAGLVEGDYLVTLVGVLPGSEVRLDRAAVAVAPAVSVADAAVAEGDGGTAELRFEVTLSSALDETVEVDFATADGTAVSPADYQGAAGTLTFEPGTTRRTVTVTVFGDLEPESEEVLLLGLSNPVGALIGDGQAIGALRDEEGCASPDLVANGGGEEGTPADPVPGWQEATSGWQRRFADPPPLAGSAYLAYGGTAALAELFQDVDVAAFAEPIDAGLQDFLFAAFVETAAEAVPDTARAVVEYRDPAGNVLGAFDSGELSTEGWQALTDLRRAPVGARVVRLRLIGRRTDETARGLDAHFERVTLSSLGAATLTVTGAAVTEGDPPTPRFAPVAVDLSCALASDLLVDYHTADGTAVAGADYVAAAGSLTIAAGERRATIEVEVLGDLLDEPDEELGVAVSAADAVVLVPGARVVLFDDDGPVTVSIGDVNAPEGDAGTSAAVFELALSSPSGKTVRVDYETASASALAGSDFESVGGSVTLPPGSAAASIAVPIAGDRLDEPDESFTVELTGAVNAAIDEAEGLGTIFDDDVVEIRADDPSVVEGDSGGVTVTFTVTLSLPSVRQVSVDYATADGEALAGADYVATSGTLLFAPGETSAAVTVAIASDLEPEQVETFLLVLSNPLDAVLADPEGAASIVDDDGLLISVADTVVRETVGEARIPVTLSKAATAEVTVEFHTSDGTALAGEDYETASATLTFPVGATRADATVQILDDLAAEPAETFFVELSGALEGMIFDPSGEVTILDDDTWRLNGSADDAALPACIVLTPSTGGNGSAWRAQTLDLAESFDKTFRIFVGFNEGGADGAVFALQNRGTGTLGASGQGMGYSGISPSVGVELDTFRNGGEPVYDHVAVDLNGNVGHQGHAPVPVNAGGNVEDGLEHELRIIWNHAKETLDARLDGEERLYMTRDLIGSTFGGSSQVFYGFTAATGAARNLHYFCETELCEASTAPRIAVGFDRVVEGDAGTAQVAFPVTLNCPSDQIVEVAYATADGGSGLPAATAGNDYLAASGVLIFQPGETGKTVLVDVLGDAETESDESFFLELSAPSGGVVRYGRGLATILTDDVGVRAVAGTVVPEGATTYSQGITLELAAPPASSVTVSYATADGTAQAGSDYTALEGSVTFEPGDTRRDVSVEIRGDDAVEGDEHFFLDLSGSFVANVRVRVDLLDDDECPSANLLLNASNDEPTVGGELPGWIQLAGRWAPSERRGALDGPFYFVSGSAAFGELVQDVDVSSFTASIDGGEQLFVFEGWTRTDPETLPDPARVVVEYRAKSGALLAAFDTGDVVSAASWQRLADLRAAPAGTRTLRVRLLTTRFSGSANDASFDALALFGLRTPSASVGDVALVEGESGQSDALFPVALTCPGTVPVTVDYLTVDGTAKAGSDYEATFGTFTFPPGTTAGAIAVPVLGDTVVEPEESFFLDLVGSSGGAIGDGRGVGTLLPDEVSVAVGDARVVEGNGGDTADMLFTATLSGTSALPVAFDFSASGGGTATPEVDFLPASGRVTVAPGTTTATFIVPVVGDLEVEDHETFLVLLRNPVNATLAAGSAQGTIDDDDLALGVSGATTIEGDGGTREAVFTVTLAAPSAVPVTVDYATLDATAVAGLDYLSAAGTLTLAPGETVAGFTVQVLGDTELEPSETFLVELGNAANAALGVREGIGIIVDDDDCPGPQLLANAGNEEPLLGGSEVAGWTEAAGTAWTRRISGPAPFEGDGYFAAGNVAAGELAQDVDVSAYAPLIDAGIERFLFEAWVRSAAETPADTARVVVEYRDAENAAVLDAFDSGDVASVDAWTQLVDFKVAPPGTRFVRVRLLARRSSGTGNDAYFDAVSLLSLGTPTFVVADVSHAEGDSGASDADFTVTLNCPLEEEVSVDFTTVDGTASAPLDYEATSGTLTFAPGETLATVPVAVFGDTLIEADETLRFRLSGSSVPILLRPQGLLTIVDDENLPGTVTLVGTVRDFLDTHPDFESVTGSGDPGIVEPILGADGKPVYTGLAGNPSTHGQEAFDQWYRDVPGINLGADLPIVLTHSATSDPRAYTFNDATFFPIDNQLFGNQGRSHNYHFTYEIHSQFLYLGGEVFTFRGDDDVWVFLNDRLVVDLGGVHSAQTQSIHVDALAPSIGIEPGGVYSFTLFFAERHTVASSFRIDTTLLLAQVDPGTLEFTSPTYEVTEAGLVATIGVVRTGGVDRVVAVDYATVPGGTATAADDYAAASGTITFLDGEGGLKTFTVPIADDLEIEGDETVGLALAHLTGGARLGLSEAVLTILDDDLAGEPDLVASKVDALAVDADGDGVASPGDVVRYTVTVGNVGDADAAGVTVRDLVPEHTALVAGSVTSSSGTLVSDSPLEVEVGDLTAGATLTVTFDVTIAQPFPLGVTEISNQATVTSAGLPAVLTDDPDVGGDADPTATPVFITPDVSAGDVTVAESDGQASFPILLSEPGIRPLTLTFETAPGTALAGLDFETASGTLIVAAGKTGATIAVPLIADFLDELDETFALRLTAVEGGRLADDEGIGTIVDDDLALIRIDDVTLEEGDTGTTDAVFTVTLATAADREIRVDYATAPENATAGVDYLTTAATLVFPAGATEKTLSVAVAGDLILEPDETFRVELANAVETRIEDGVGLGTILDDETCPGPNLLENPGAERREVDGAISGWTNVEGDWRRHFGPPEPLEGRAQFFAGDAAFSELFQDVDVSPYASRISAGDQEFLFTAFVRTFDEAPPDVVRILVEYRDAANIAVLDSFDSGELASPLGWTEVADLRAAPAGTGWIRVSLLATRFAGAEIESFVDALSLVSLRSPTLTIDDVTVEEGDDASTDALFTVRLACPYESDVDVSYLSIDDTALAGTDYLSVGGSLHFPTATTAQTVPVPVVGDEVGEPAETFFVELADLASQGDPVLLDPLGLGTILDDDFCPRSHGFWKNHTDDWPIAWVSMGGVEYEADEMLAFLESKGSDATNILALQGVATKLNLASGSDPYIVPTVEAADAFLELYPPGSDPRGAARDEALRLKDELDAYNNLPCDDESEDGGGRGHGNSNGNGHGNGNGNGGD